MAAALRRCGAAQLTLRTDSDWIADIVRFALARKRGLVGGGPVTVLRPPLVAAAARSWWPRSSSGYLLLLRRRRRDTMRFTNLELLERVAPKRPGWYRHLPAVALIAALAVLTVALAGPMAEARVPRNRATVVLVIDVSLSMQATDVAAEPAGRRAGRGQAVRRPAHARGQPGAGGVRRAPPPCWSSPTADREPVKRAIDGLKLAESTATGEAIFAALQSIETFSQAVAGASDEGPPPARIVLMSDGKQTVPGGVDAGGGAARLVHRGPRGGRGQDPGVDDLVRHRVRLDRDQRRASAVPVAGGRRVDAQDRRAVRRRSSSPPPPSEELRQVYAELGEQIGYEIRRVDTSRPWLAGGSLLLVAGVGAGLALGRRLP